VSLSALALACASSQKEAPPPKADPSAEPKTAPAPKTPEGPPPMWKDASTLAGGCAEKRKSVEEARAALTTPSDEKDDQKTLERMNTLLFALDSGIAVSDLMANVHPDKAARESAERCEQDLKQLATEINLDRAVFDTVRAVDAKSLDPEAQRFVEKVLRDFHRAGVDKDEKTRGRLKALQDEMVKVGQEFNRNMREDVRSIELDPKELDGLPDDFIQAHKPNDKGKVVISTNYPDFFPIESYAKSEDVRKRLAVEFLNRASQKNDEVLKKLLELRAEFAKLLGYKSWADYEAEDKMVKSARNIEKLIADLEKIARPRMQKDLKDLIAAKKKQDPKSKAIEVWDRFYWVDRVRSERYGFDAKSVRAYFEFDSVVKGLFQLYGELFGLRFERSSTLPVWHESVLAYEVYSGDKRIGHFYLDFHPREGKYGHAAMFNMTTGLSGGPEPEAALVCNFPDPSKTSGPALMEHGDVRTLFHEFGHLIHHLLAQSSKWVNESGISVEWDFVEAPSQLLEEWVWDPAVLARFAKHYETKQPIPAELVQKMRSADEFGKGTTVMRQLHLTAMSYELHAKDPKKLDLTKFAKEVAKKYSPYPFVPGTHEYDSFGHLEGYSSMYYTYQWSLVIAKDLFTRFAKAGLLDAPTAADYRMKILVPGGTKDAASLVKDFLGRDSNLDAYRAWLERD
jgi:thimet oligopeptidase